MADVFSQAEQERLIKAAAKGDDPLATLSAMNAFVNDVGAGRVPSAATMHAIAAMLGRVTALDFSMNASKRRTKVTQALGLASGWPAANERRRKAAIMHFEILRSRGYSQTQAFEALGGRDSAAGAAVRRWLNEQNE